MINLNDLFQAADWKSEKHVPVIETKDTAKKQELISVTVSVGKEMPHPNTTEHHIRWIELYFQPKAEKFPYQLGRFEFNAHGESVQGPNISTVYAHPAVICNFKTEKPGALIAFSYCNIHGLWRSEKDLNVE